MRCCGRRHAMPWGEGVDFAACTHLLASGARSTPQLSQRTPWSSSRVHVRTVPELSRVMSWAHVALRIAARRHVPKPETWLLIRTTSPRGCKGQRPVPGSSMDGSLSAALIQEPCQDANAIGSMYVLSCLRLLFAMNRSPGLVFASLILPCARVDAPRLRYLRVTYIHTYIGRKSTVRPRV
ncbi:hypothetical protein BKA81DRAFT_12152 [Phyllosticta paracitricarpa]|uniref:Uncharacterized protein n=1 Tax=Phyllosticta citricarpa TaxID=55181 RepID=A0ABR1MPE9_9PEZI